MNVIRRIAAGAGLLAALAASGCKSPYISVTVQNETGGPISLLEVDYPSASFGKESLAANAAFPYRFKIIGSGETKVSWTDDARKQHTANGPRLFEGQHGPLTITLTASGAQWSEDLTPKG